MKKSFLFLLVSAWPCLTAAGQTTSQPSAQTFTNPLLPSGPDPWVVQHDGTYYYMNTTGQNLTIWKTQSIADLGTAEKKVVWVPPSGQAYSKEIWAPELHFLNGGWYIYFAGDAGSNESHRLWVIGNKSADPLQGEWSEPHKLTTAEDRWAIDGSVFEDRGQLYFIWSGWEGDKDGGQNIYIARMKDPMTLTGPRVRLSASQYPWEKVGDLPGNSTPHVDVNEGPEMLKHGDKLFLIYSASGCWTDYYALGELTATSGSNLLDARSWTKSPRPVLSTLNTSHAFGTGHNGFFKSPSGQQDWIIYHANPEPHQGCRNDRSPRAQPFIWNADGTPNFGPPVPLGQRLEIPK